MRIHIGINRVRDRVAMYSGRIVDSVGAVIPPLRLQHERYTRVSVAIGRQVVDRQSTVWIGDGSR